MGNKCPTCICGPEGRGLRDCFGCSKRKDKGSGINPSDLHASGVVQKSVSKTSVKCRPETLQVKADLNSDHSQLNSKFSNFSLHGIQKSSPQTPSSSAYSPGMEVVKHQFSLDKLEELFNKYKDGQCILAEGIESFCEDLNVDPTEFIVLAIAWKFKAQTMCKFTRDEFITGCTDLQVDSIKTMKEKFSDILQDADLNFKDLYKFTFQFGLDIESGQRSLPADIAVELWKLVFENKKPEMLDAWLEFVTEKKVRGISRDTWLMFLHFTEVVGSDLTKYDDSEAWPSVFDDFVEHYKAMEECEKLAIENEIELKKYMEINETCEISDITNPPMFENILPPPYDPPPYTSKEALHEEDPDVKARKIVVTPVSDASSTSVDMPGIIGAKTPEKPDEDATNNSNGDVVINNLHSS